MKNTFILLTLVFGLFACQKKMEPVASAISINSSTAKTSGFVAYTIAKGEQYCNQNSFVAVDYQQLSFIVQFDSSAIYQTVSPSNQTDINKLFGFSDNNTAHHQYSARFGWRWSNNALRLFGYIYNNGVMSFKELGTIGINEEISCSIKVTATTYVFIVNGKETYMPRSSTTSSAQGYKLYPFFGGTETAPHAISILIKEL